LLLSILVIGSAAEAAYLGGVTFDRPSPSVLPHSTPVSVTIDYKVDDPAGGVIFARPFTAGAPTPGYSASGGTFVAQGSGTATQSFTILHGNPVVDAVRVYLRSTDLSEVVLELFVPAIFQYGPHGFYNIEPSRTRDSRLRHGQLLTIDFDYAVNAPGCRIFARPFNNGQLVPGYFASGSGVLPPSGSHTQWFYFNADADITHIRLQAVDLDGATLCERLVPWPCHWRAWGLYDISFNHDDLTSLHNSQNLVATFTIDHVDPDGLRVWIWCLQGGHYCPGTVYQPSALEPAGAHTVTRFTRVNTGCEDVDAIRFVVGHPGQHYLEFDIPLRLAYGPHAIQNIAFVPAAPAILSHGQRLDMAFDYLTDEAAGVLIFGRAAYQQSLLGGYHASGSPHYPAPSGSGSGWTYFNSDRIADSIRFQMRNLDQTSVLLEWFEPGWFIWGAAGAVTTAPTPAVLATVLGPVFPNPFNPTATIPVSLARDEHVRLAVFDARGRLVRHLHDGLLTGGEHRFTLHADGLGSGVYLCRLETPTGVQNQRLTLLK